MDWQKSGHNHYVSWVTVATITITFTITITLAFDPVALCKCVSSGR